MTDDVEMKVDEVDEVDEVPEKIIDISINEEKPVLQVNEEKLKEMFKISNKTLTYLKSMLQIISQRKAFKIEEYKIVGTFYESLNNIEDELISGDSIQVLLNIIHTLLKRGIFQINELQIVADLYSSLQHAVS
jgi:hypothetical protein